MTDSTFDLLMDLEIFARLQVALLDIVMRKTLRLLLGACCLLACCASPTADSGFIAVNDSKIFFSKTGRGHAIVLLHGGLMDSRMWEPQLSSLVDEFTVIRLDLTGHGRTIDGDSSYRMHKAVKALADTLGIEKFFLVGHSMGGAVATDFAIDYPEYLHGVVLVCPGINGWDRMPPDSALDAKMSLMMQTLMEKKDTVRAVELFLEAWFDGPNRTSTITNSSAREQAKKIALENARKHRFAKWPMYAVEPATTRLSLIKVPILIVEGSDDHNSIHLIADTLVSGIDHAERTVIEGTAHMPSLEQPSKFDSVLGRFLRRNMSIK